MTDIITIVTPSFNQEAFLKDSIMSVVSQEGDFLLDYIVKDGGSTDGSLAIIRDCLDLLRNGAREQEYQGHSWLFPSNGSSPIRCRGVSFRWYSGADRGQSHAINEGFALGLGELAGWVNSDDALFQGTLARVLRIYRRTGRVIFGKALAVDETGREMWTQAFWKKKYSLFDSFVMEWAPPQPSVFFPLSLYRRLGGLNENLHYLLDGDLWQRMLLKVRYFLYVPEVWSRQTYHPAAKSMKGGSLFAAFKDEKRMVWSTRARELRFRVPLMAARKSLRSDVLRVSDFGKRAVRFLLKRMGFRRKRPQVLLRGGS